MWFHLIFKLNLRDRYYYYFHFTDIEIGIQKRVLEELECKNWCLDPQARDLNRDPNCISKRDGIKR